MDERDRENNELSLSDNEGEEHQMHQVPMTKQDKPEDQGSNEEENLFDINEDIKIGQDGMPPPAINPAIFGDLPLRKPKDGWEKEFQKNHSNELGTPFHKVDNPGMWHAFSYTPKYSKKRVKGQG